MKEFEKDKFGKDKTSNTANNLKDKDKLGHGTKQSEITQRPLGGAQKTPQGGGSVDHSSNLKWNDKDKIDKDRNR